MDDKETHPQPVTKALITLQPDACLPADSVTEMRPNEADTLLASMAKAIAHPARVRILKLLLDRDACPCGQICDELPLAQSTVSQHLKVLKDAGLVTGTVDGPRVCYHPNPLALAQLKTLVNNL